MILFIYRISVI